MKGLTGGARSDSFYLRFSKWSTVAWAGALILVAYLSREVPYVLDAAFSLRGLTSGALLGALGLVIFWRKESYVPIFVGMIGSLLAMIAISRFEWVVSQAPTVQTAKVAWPWYTLIGTIICVGLAWVTRSIIPKGDPQRAA